MPTHEDQGRDTGLTEGQQAILDAIPVKGDDAAPPAGDPPPPVDTPPTTEPVVVNDITRLEVARALPEITGDAKTSKPKAAEGAIERFYSADDRLMSVVEFKGALHCLQIAEPTDRDNAEA